MNRRSFIASLLAVPATLVVAAKAFAKPAARQVWFVDWSDIELKAPPEQLTVRWFQTPRITRCSSIAYEDTIDQLMIPDVPTRRKNWHERRKERSRQNMALLKTQRVLPLP